MHVFDALADEISPPDCGFVGSRLDSPALATGRKRLTTAGDCGCLLNHKKHRYHHRVCPKWVVGVFLVVLWILRPPALECGSCQGYYCTQLSLVLRSTSVCQLCCQQKQWLRSLMMPIYPWLNTPYGYFSLLLLLDRPMHNARTRTSFLCYCRVTVSP
jgi:hypothetical protein